MSNEKLKSENYQEFGGMNSKSSPYVTGPMEFLNLQNLDFQTPGALTQRWGSTMYVGQTFAQAPLLLSEYIKLDGTSYVIIGTTGGLWYGATTGNSKGMSFTWLDTTFNYGGTDAIGDFHLYYPGTGALGVQLVTCNPNGSSFLSFPERPLLNGDPSLPFGNGTAGAAFVRNTTLIAAGNPTDVAVFGDWLFGADGNKFWKFNGTTTFMAQLIPPLNHGLAAGGASSINHFSQGLTNTLGFGLSGYLAFYASYTNNRGVEGPIWPIAVFNGGSLDGGTAAAAVSATMLSPYWTFWPPVEYGVTSISIYSFYSGNYIDLNTEAVWSNPYVFNANYPVGYQLGTIFTGPTMTQMYLGTTFGGLTSITTNDFPAPANPKYIAMGISYLPYNTGTAAGLSAVSIGSYSPQYLEVYQNRMFLAGFSTTPSTVWFSDTGEPEGYFDDSNFEVRTNDGDVITCMKSYSTRLYIFKKRSFHVLTGDNPNNFFLSELSDQYGCLNNNCAVVYEDILLFLDQKGVIMWNGANIQVLSAKIQPIFDRMNFSAAKRVACLAHDKLRNQVVVAIPVDGSADNNLYAVYDYLAGAWTTYTGSQSPTYLAQIQGRNNTKNLFFGEKTGSVNWFGASFLTDNGVGITTYWKTRFLHDLGDTTQKMFRRLYLNVDSPSSSTLTFNINFYQDYGSSIVLSATFPLSQFQNRYDYGVSAKSLAFEMYNIQTSSVLRLYGFTIESRFMRRV